MASFMGKPLLIMILLSFIVVMHTCQARKLGETEVAKESTTPLEAEAEAEAEAIVQQTTHLPNSQPLKYDVPDTSYLIPPMLDVPISSYLVPPQTQHGQQMGQIVRLFNSQVGAAYHQPLRFGIPSTSYGVVPPNARLGQQMGQIVRLSNSRVGSAYGQPLRFDVPDTSYLIPPMLNVPGSSYVVPPQTAANIQSRSP